MKKQKQKKQLQSNSKPYEEIKISSEDKVMENIKATIILLICNLIFHLRNYNSVTDIQCIKM